MLTQGGQRHRRMPILKVVNLDKDRIMLKKVLLAVVAFFVFSGMAAAAVDVNTASQAQLETLKGIGAAKSKAIVEERAKNGPFKSAEDLARRVKGLGSKSVAKLEAEGLTFGGKTAAPVTSSKHRDAKGSAHTADKPVKKSATNQGAASSPAGHSAQK